MDKFRYEKIVDELYYNLDLMKKNIEIITDNEINKNELSDLNNKISKNIRKINNFSVGLYENSKFYNGLKELQREYTNLRNELKSDYTFNK